MKQKLKFPEGFLWGASTSSYQVEGGIHNNDWAVSDRVPKAGVACDTYNRFREDFAIAKYLHHNAHRMSLEWARIEPERGRFDEDALYHYHGMLSWLRDNGLRTFVTLHHFTSPLWFARDGGWASPRATEHFERYTAKVVQSLGHLVDFWVTINEPNVYSLCAYVIGIFPPFEKNIPKSFRVYRAMLRAHNRAYEVIHNYDRDAHVGFAQNFSWRRAERRFNFLDRIFASFMNWTEYHLPFRITKNDFIGVNHYHDSHIRFSFSQAKHFVVMTRHGGQMTDRGWAMHGHALYQVLVKLKSLGKPIYITENGLADQADKYRANFIHDYLGHMHNAIRDGADVRGYLHWSLLDNFEWEDGYKWKFGLVAVDFKTLKRTIRESAFAYSHICQDNALPPLNLPLNKGEKERK